MRSILKTPVLFAQLGQYTMQVKLTSLGICDLWRVQPTQIGGEGRSALLYLLQPAYATDRLIVDEFLSAGKLAKRLRHPNIVTTDDVVEDDLNFGIVTEYVPGITVHELACQVRACKNSLPPWFALEVAHLVCAALRHAHSLRDDHGDPAPILHRTLDSSAVTIAESGQVKLAHFGIGEFLAQRDRPFSISVQQRRAAPSDDIAGVAAILCELMWLSETPTSARDATDWGGARQQLQVSPHLPRQLENLLRRASEPRRSDGFIEIGQFADSLDSYILERRQRVKSEHLAAFVKVIAISGRMERAASVEHGSARPFGALLSVSAASAGIDLCADEETARQLSVGTNQDSEAISNRQTMPTQPNLVVPDEQDWVEADPATVDPDGTGAAMDESASEERANADTPIGETDGLRARDALDSTAEIAPPEDSIVFDAPEVLCSTDEFRDAPVFEGSSAAAVVGAGSAASEFDDDWDVTAVVGAGSSGQVLDKPERSRPSSHNWQAAIESVRPPPSKIGDSSYPRPMVTADASQLGEHHSTLAIAAFEEGFERLRAGDLDGAESIWRKALEFDPDFRAAAINLKRVQKRRSEPPR